ncbi:MAG: hypothetical protein ACSHX6_00405 [Akkermansiaceae bacterium]
MKIFAFLILSSLVALPNTITSFYSSTNRKHVAVLESSELLENPEIDFFVELCPGFGGYELLHHGGDGRSIIEIKYGEKVSDLYRDTLKASPGVFAHVANEVVEWRGVVKGQSFTPHAIIYRYSGTSDEAKQSMKSVLLVIALNKGDSKLLGSFSGKDESEKARALADTLLKEPAKKATPTTQP